MQNTHLDLGMFSVLSLNKRSEISVSGLDRFPYLFNELRNICFKLNSETLIKVHKRWLFHSHINAFVKTFRYCMYLSTSVCVCARACTCVCHNSHRWRLEVNNKLSVHVFTGQCYL